MNEPLILGYLTAQERIVSAGFSEDIDWALGLQHVNPTPHYVLREYAWVVVNSGFRYQVARKLWPSLYEAFREFDPELTTWECLPEALKILNHRGKMEGVCKVAREIHGLGVQGILADAKDPPRLKRLPWIGDITCWHLAKVLGVDAVKPDVHLQRAAKAAGFKTPLELAQAIQRELGERLTVVDSVLWRYGEQRLKQGWADWAELFNG